jgi:hypothetical protein
LKGLSCVLRSLDILLLEVENHWDVKAAEDMICSSSCSKVISLDTIKEEGKRLEVGSTVRRLL